MKDMKPIDWAIFGSSIMLGIAWDVWHHMY